MASADNQSKNTNSKAPWYKSALFPWMLFVIVLAITGGFIGGWHVRSGHMIEISEVRAEVSEQLKAQTVSTTVKK